MLPAQQVFRFIVMIKYHLPPSTSVVTRLAFIPVATTVFIITTMASDAFCTQLLLMQFPRMANVALHTPMFSGEWIFRVMIMIELRSIPACLRVTVLAFLSVTTGMCIIQPVTGDTFPRYILVSVVDVAAVTREFCMFIPQYEIRIIVIEFLAAPPVLGMAIRTLLTKPTHMDVIILMACNAVLWCIAEFFPGNMTGVTASHTMRAL